MWSIMGLPSEIFLLILLNIFIGSSETYFIFDCGETKCRSSTDCIKINGVAQCADPCEHYTALHDDWRSINNTQLAAAHNDINRDWEGWYRLFLGQADARLPETCVLPVGCGAISPMWLNSRHGNLLGKIVGRQTCNALGGECCNYYSGTIFLKYCYGDYYVYKLLEPFLSGSAYCAEVMKKDPGASTTTSEPKTRTSHSPSLASTPSTTTAGNSTGTEGQIRLNSGGKYSCSGRVEIFHSGQWGTVCDDSWDLQDASVACRQLGCGRALSAPHDAAFGPGSGPIWLDDVRCFGNETALKNCQHSGFGVHNCGHHKDAGAVCEFHHPPPQLSQLICARDKLQVGVQLTSMASSGLDPFSGNLAARSCSWVRVNNDIVWYEVEAEEGACGNILRTNSTHAIFSNSLFVYPDNNASLALPVSLPFSCVYPLDTDTSFKEAIRPSQEWENAVSGSGARARAHMSLFRNADYTETYPAGQVTLPVGSPLYVGVSVEEIDSNFVVVLENCFASHSSSPEDPSQDPLIQNKCPINSREVSVVESGSSLQARFSALLFMLQDGNEDIYLHCGLSLCDQRNHDCVPNCQKRMSRSVSSSATVKTVTTGPIVSELQAN